jgi:hypothetical protein
MKDRTKENGKIFIKYIIITCWKKMYRRVFNWASFGFIKHLAAISPETLREVEEKLADHRVIDHGLESYLRRLSIEAFNKLISPTQNGENLGPPPSLDALRPISDDRVVYQKSTIPHFHNTLIRLLLSYACGLARLAKAYKWTPRRYDKGSNESPLTSDILMAVDDLLPIVEILSVIIHSNALARHFQLLDTLGKLEMPVRDRKLEYEEFVMSFVDAKPAQPVHAASTAKPAQPDVNNYQIGSHGGEEEEGEELLTMAHAQADPLQNVLIVAPQADKVFRKWIFTLVSHLTATRTLKKHVKGLTLPEGTEPVVKFFLVGVKRKRDESFANTWEDMRTCIRDLTAGEVQGYAGICVEKLEHAIQDLRLLHKSEPNDHGLQTDAARFLGNKGMLKRPSVDQSNVAAVQKKKQRKKIGSVLGMGRPSSVKGKHNTSSAMQNPVEDQKSPISADSRLFFYGNQHCEAILAALIRQYQDWMLDHSSPEGSEVYQRTQNVKLREIIGVCCLPKLYSVGLS